MKKTSLKNLKIYLAGHNGMVGRALFDNFKKIGAKKIIISSRKNLDLLDVNKLRKFIKKNKPDIIINCAGRVGGILANSTYPVQFLNENILIQLNLINLAFENNVKHFINLGSSCIYPKNSKQPIKENYLLTSPLEKTNEAYALAKIIGLKACDFYNQQYKTNYFTLMPCNLYGPHDNFHLKNSHFIPALIKKFIEAKRTKKNHVEIWGSGLPKREVMYVDDLADAIIFLLNLKVNNNKKLLKSIRKNSLINIGSGQEYSISKFAKIINEITSANKRLKFNKKYPDGTLRKVLDISLIKKLGWKSKMKLANGLRSTIKWYTKNY
jgi:GDP-L-fucose synthase